MKSYWSRVGPSIKLIFLLKGGSLDTETYRGKMMWRHTGRTPSELCCHKSRNIGATRGWKRQGKIDPPRHNHSLSSFILWWTVNTLPLHRDLVDIVLSSPKYGMSDAAIDILLWRWCSWPLDLWELWWCGRALSLHKVYLPLFTITVILIRLAFLIDLCVRLDIVRTVESK